MSKEAQVKQLTDYMAKFIAYTAKKLPDDVIAKLEELRDRKIVHYRRQSTIQCLRIRS